MSDINAPNDLPLEQKKFKLPKWEELAYAIKASGMKERLWFTFFALAVYRFAVQVPVWGVNAEALKQYRLGF